MHRDASIQAELPHWQRRGNGLLSKVRVPVEQALETLKRCYGLLASAYGLGMNTAEALFKAMTYNSRRAGGPEVSGREVTQRVAHLEGSTRARSHRSVK